MVTRRDAGPADAASLSGTQLQQAVLGLIRRWHPDLRRLLAECDPGSAACFPFLASTHIPACPGSKVTLLGDAIHSMPPTGGLGANNALRDARLLAWHLDAAAAGRCTLREAIRGYEQQMRSYAPTAVRASLTTLRQGLLTNPAAVAATRAWLRLSGTITPLRRAGFRSNWAQHTVMQPWEQVAVVETASGQWHGPAAISRLSGRRHRVRRRSGGRWNRGEMTVPGKTAPGPRCHPR